MAHLAQKALVLFAAAGLFVSPLMAAGGGGGGGSSAPSQSAPSYDPTVEYKKGVEAFDAQKYKAAAKAFKRVVSAVPKHAPAQYLLGASYIALGKYKKAKRPLAAAVKYAPKMIEARRDLGITHANLGKADKAAKQLASLKTMKAACTNGCSDGTKLDDAIAKVEAAIAGDTKAAGISPDIQLSSAKSADQTYIAAVSLINEKRYNEAIALLDDALWSAGPHPDILTYMGFAHRKLKQYDTAKAYYEAALAVAPDHLGAIEYYGELKLELGNIRGAKAHLARLDQLCGFGCYEANELRGWIKDAKQSAS